MAEDTTPIDVQEFDSELEAAKDQSSSSCICRDFLRNVCRRGDRCRFLHPADPTSARRDVIAASHHRPLVFCHDFQNAAGCKRGTSCRFAHCTRDEEAAYGRTGLLPVHVHRKLALDVAISKALLRGETPVCLDFIKAGGCRRANGKCRYRHVTAAEFEWEQLSADEHRQMSLQRHCVSELDPYIQQQATLNGASAAAAAAALLYRKRKLRPEEENSSDDVVFCETKLGCTGNSFIDPVATPSAYSLGQLVAVMEPANHSAATNRWNTQMSQPDFRQPFRLVAVPSPATFGIQTAFRFASSSPGIAMVAPSTSAASFGFVTVLQPYGL